MLRFVGSGCELGYTMRARLQMSIGTWQLEIENELSFLWLR